MKTDVSITPVMGYRYWGMTDYNDGTSFVPRLLSYGNTVWEPGVQLRAKCYAGVNHPVPQTFCSCGIYARKTLKQVEELPMLYEHSTISVVGEVDLGGTVIEAAYGYVASLAYPRSFYLPPKPCWKRLAEGWVIRWEDEQGVEYSATCSCPVEATERDDRIRELAEIYDVETKYIEDKCQCKVHCDRPDRIIDEHRKTAKSDTGPGTEASTYTITFDTAKAGAGKEVSAEPLYTRLTKWGK